MNITKSDAIKSLHPNVGFSFINGRINLWESDEPQPTEAQIEAKVAELTAAKPMQILRQERTQLLAQSDWMANSDVTMTEEWRVYRQALRDITTQTPSLDADGNLTGITWPTPPTD